MTIKQTIIISLLGALLLVSNGYLIKRHLEMSTALSTAVEQVAKVDLNLGKARVLIADQALVHERALKELDSKQKEFIENQKASVEMLLNVRAQLRTLEKKVKVQTQTITSGNPIIAADIPLGELFIKKVDGTYESVKSLLWSYQDHRITASGDAVKKEFTYKLHQSFKGRVVETKTKHGPEYLVELNEIDASGKVVNKLTLTELEVLRAKEKEHGLSWWNPKLDIGISGVATESLSGRILLDVGLSVASYGNELNPKWRFLRIGIGGVINEGLSVTVSPVVFNISRYLPVLSNIAITPIMGYVVPTKEFFAGGGISLTL